MPKHHIVQKEYLKQWYCDDNQLNIYSTEEDKIKRRGAGWPGFSIKDFNILDDVNDKYLPEKFTAYIDAKGIKTIKDINYGKQLNGYERSAIAFYVALQYIRTPKHRSEINSVIDTIIKIGLRDKFSSVDKIIIPDEKQAINEDEKKAIKKINALPKIEAKKQLFEAIQNDGYVIKLTNTGHSKWLFKLNEIAKKLFENQWIFIVPPKKMSMITSDNPCFVYSKNNRSVGLSSLDGVVHFPLRPDLHLVIIPKIKSPIEIYKKEGKNAIKSINQLIVENSYNCFVAKDVNYLKRMIRYFKKCNYKKNRDVKIDKFGKYIKISSEK